MLVKALPLWHRDVKLTADELRAQTPMVGRLRYTAAPYAGRDGRGALTYMLMPADPQKTDLLVQLFHAKLRIIDDRGIRIHGEEDEWRRKQRTSCKQVLWCWPASDADLQPAPRDPYEVEDEQAAPRRALSVPDYVRAGKRANV